MNPSNTWGPVPEHLQRSATGAAQPIQPADAAEQSLPPTNRWSDRLPALLRGFGAAAVLFSLYSFLFRGWEGSDDLVRYLMLLGHTIALVAIALSCGRFLHEGKSPRILMMLALVSVPLNFSILGAFLYAGSHSLIGTEYPPYVTWSVGSLTTAAVLTVMASLCLLPVIWLAFRTLARGLSLRLCSLFMLGNLALLIPLREPLPVFLLGTALALYTLVISAKSARQRTEARTLEGMVALLLQFVPVAILLGRNLWLYQNDGLLLTGIGITLFIVLRHLGQSLPGQHWGRRLLELLSLPLALVTGLALSGALVESRAALSLVLLLGPLLAAGMQYELAERAASAKGLYRSCAMLTLLCGILLNLVLINAVLPSLLSLGAGLALVVYSHMVQQRSLFIGGLILLLAGLADQLIHAFDYFDFSYWIGLALVGVSAIILASLLEARGTELRHWLKRYKKDHADWSF